MNFNLLFILTIICICSINARKLKSEINRKYNESSKKIHAFTQHSERAMHFYTHNINSAIMNGDGLETPEQCIEYAEKIASIFDQCVSNIENCQNNANDNMKTAIESVEPNRKRIAEISNNLKERLISCDNLYESDSSDYFQCYVDHFDENLYDIDVISSLSQTSLLILNNNFTSIENEALMCINEATMESKLNMTKAVNDYQKCILNPKNCVSSEVTDSVANSAEEILPANPNESVPTATNDNDPIAKPSNDCIEVKGCSDSLNVDLTKELHFVSLNKIAPALEPTDNNQQNEKSKQAEEANAEENLLNSYKLKRNLNIEKLSRDPIFNLMFHKSLKLSSSASL